MIVFYTFDLPLNIDSQSQDEKLLMLKISIYTVIRELTNEDVKIFIYSNNPAILKIKLFDIFPFIKYFKISSKFSKIVENGAILKQRFDGLFKDANEIYRVINNQFGTAHYRVFILNQILLNNVDNVLYLDYDTGIAKGKGSDAKCLLVNSEIILEPKTSHSVLDDIRNIYPEFNQVVLPKYINPYASRWNCGIMFIKNTAENKLLSKSIFKYYRWLNRDLGFTQSADEWSIGLALFHSQKVPSITFEHTKFYSNQTLKLLNDDLPKPSPFVHYMDQKNIETNQKKFKYILNKWRKFFEGKSLEPTFMSPNYKKKNSNDFIWGRFESL